MTPDQPHTFPRRIMLAVTGLTPQVVTETLYALAQRQPAFVPTEVHIVTTAEGAERVRLALLSDDPGWFGRLCRDFGLSGIRFDESQIHLLTDEYGRAIDDNRSLEDNRRAADIITDTVRELTSDPTAAVHASLAGGRKTMGYYLGYALSLFGRPQDRLSHVLVSEPFESSWDFFYPTPYERVIQTRGEKLADCREAQVTLAEIPFVRLREGLPRRLLAGSGTLTDTVEAANRAMARAHLVFDVGTREVRADGERIDLGATEAAVLLWFAERARLEQPDIDWATREAADEFMKVAARVINSSAGAYERIEKALASCHDDRKALADYFEPHKSGINKALAEALGEHAAQRYQIRRGGVRGASRYYLALAPDEIEIRG